jgi:hypothetical protein
VLLAVLQGARGEVVTIATWNLEWFPGGKPNSSHAERVVHMSAAKDALTDIRPDILRPPGSAGLGQHSRAGIHPAQFSNTGSEQIPRNGLIRSSLHPADRHCL